MTSRDEAERLLSSLSDEDLVEIDSNGNIYAAGKAPAAGHGKSIAGISDQKGEYGRVARWISA
jgi:hypothetical protein